MDFSWGRKVAWYSHLLKYFRQFVVIHTVKGFSVVSEVVVDVFLEFSCFYNDPTDVGSLISGSFAFSKSSLNIWKFSLHVLLKPSLRILSITLLACKMIPTVWQLEYSLELPFFGIGMKIDLFHSCMYCWIFQFCWCIEYSTATTSFRIWSSSAGIPLPPIAFFILMLPKAHLTSYSKMSGSRWVITPLWLSGSLRFFCIVLCSLAISS